MRGNRTIKYRETQYQAEGLSYTRLKDLIILWEVYQKLDDGNIEVQTFSPLAPDEPARATFKIPYDHHQVPIAALPYEWLDEMFYSSPRGDGTGPDVRSERHENVE